MCAKLKRSLLLVVQKMVSDVLVLVEGLQHESLFGISGLSQVSGSVPQTTQVTL